ncbi:MAG: small subunit ribosomal protein S4 [Kiritimatiellia bacterium]|jgi:small subunit ribosomal protein S4
MVHGHVEINGRRVDRPSFHAEPGDIVTLGERSASEKFMEEVLAVTTSNPRQSWLEFDPAKKSGKLTSKAERGDLPFELNEHAAIEFYSQKL